jgi:hypothetical protein
VDGRCPDPVSVKGDYFQTKIWIVFDKKSFKKYKEQKNLIKIKIEFWNIFM